MGKYLAFAALGVFYGLLLVFLPPQLVWLPGVPIVILLAIILWMLPDFGTYPEATLDTLFYFYLISFCLWPSYISLALPGLPWIGITRIALFALVLVALYSISTSADMRRQTFRVASVSKPILYMVIGYALIAFVTIPLGPRIDSAFKRSIDNLLAFTTIFFVSCFILSKRGQIMRFAKVFAVLGLIMSVIALAETAKQEVLWAHIIPSWLSVDPGLLDRILGAQARFSDGLYRTRGVFTVSLSLAEFLVLVLPFVLYFLLSAKSGAQRMIMFAAWLLICSAIFYTRARLGMVGMIATHVFFGFIWALRRHQRSARDLVGASMLYGFPIVLLFGAALIASSNRLQTMTIGGKQHAASDNARAMQRQMAIPKVLKNPIGHGGANSGTVLGFKAPGGQVTVDSHYLTTLLDFGVIGFVCWYGMILTGSWLGYRIYLSSTDPESDLAGPTSVALAVFFVSKSVLSQEETHSLVFILVPLVLCLRARQLGIVDDRPPGRSTG